ncbi:MAG: hypothetical protein V7752_09250 [Halopseudomonas sp.]
MPAISRMINKAPAKTLLVLTLSLLPISSYAQTPPPPSYQVEKQVGEIEQLNNSIDSLLSALGTAAEQQDRQPLAEEISDKVQQLKAHSAALSDQGLHREARQPLTQALTMIKIAINALKGTAPEQLSNTAQAISADNASEFVTEKRKADINKLQSSIDALTQALISIGEEKQQQAMVQDVTTQVSEWERQSGRLVEQGKLIQARQLLDQSLVEVKTAIASMRESETLIRSLNFATKQEEFDYEVDRFDTYQMLLNMLVIPRQSLTSSQREQIEQWAEQADQHRTTAGEQAKKRDYEAAITTLEQAAKVLLKAIRRGGVYLPG